METSRSFGNYDLQSALADLIDNSITAKCKKVEIYCDWNEGDPIIRIKDDGNGMSQSELNQAMKHASSDPMKSRDLDDLGRFGLGMKTASFSQAKRLTVVSKTSEIAGARWDIDKVSDDWLMEVLDDEELKIISKLHDTDGSGTEIIWEKTDRLAEDERMDEDSFNEIVSAAGKELSKIFHRFLQPDSGRKSSKIDIEVVDLCTVKPLDEETILNSVRKTGRLLVIDSSWKDFGTASQVTALVAEKGHDHLKGAIRRLGLPDLLRSTTSTVTTVFSSGIEVGLCHVVSLVMMSI